jgi:polyhydroxybutyrate depolymerase
MGHAPPLRVAAVISACLSALALAACGHAAPAKQSAPTTSPTTQAAARTANVQKLSIRVGGMRRTYLLDVPSGRYPLALALVFHGDTQTAVQTETGDWKGVAAQFNMIIAFMQGVGDSWNAGNGPNGATRAKANDIAFTRAVIKRVEANHDVDTSRVAAVGFSDGAFLTDLIGCRLADQVHLIMPMEGQLLTSTSAGCHPARPVSVFQVNQTADPEVAYGGGPVEPTGAVLSASAAIARWRALDQCTGSAASSHHFGGQTYQKWAHCAGGTTVTLDTIQGGRHDWPPSAGYLAAEALSHLP